MIPAWPALLLLAQVRALVPMDGQDLFAGRVRELCPSAHAREYQALVRWEEQLADSAVGKSPSPGVWSSLACARALLMASGAVAHEGTLMPLGTSWSRGTIDVLKRALELQPADARAAGILAALVLNPREHFTESQGLVLDDFAEALHRSVRQRVNSPEVFRACTSLLIAAGDLASARDCSARAMSAGDDSTWHWLRLARASLATDDSAAGVAAFDRAALSANDSSAINEFLYPFFIKADWARWVEVPPGNRLAWTRDSLFPPAAADTEPVSFAGRLASQLRSMPGGNPSARWYCMEQFSEECTAIQRRGETTAWTAARFHQLWDNATGEVIALVTFGVRVGSLDAPKSGTVRRAGIDIDVRTWDPEWERWSDTAFARHLAFPAATPGAAFATSMTVIPASAGITSWTLQVHQSATRRGRAFDDRHTPLDAGPLALSDLLIGGKDQGLAWEHNGGRLFVAPLGHLKRLEPAQLFYQVRSDRERPELTTTLLVRRVVENVAERDPALQLSFAGSAGRGVADRTLELDLTRVEAGSYLLEVVVRDPADGTVVRRETTLHID